MQVYPEGTHLLIPFFERPIIYDVRARPHLVESTSGSRDLQMVSCLGHFPDLVGMRKERKIKSTSLLCLYVEIICAVKHYC